VSAAGSERVLGGRYRLVREIARGGMAVIWEARDALLDRRVAVKVLHPQYAADPEFLERFRREARAAARLSHPNIVPIYDVGEDPETRTPFIVMELVEGGNLKDRIRRAAPLSDREIRSIGATLAATLDYAHRKGLIHRDVKPQNVLLGEDGRPRLTDFGIAEALVSSGATRTGALMGSVHYIAPEVVRGRKAVPQSDVYSLGTVLYEMATGRVPFEGETDLAVALAHVEQTPPAPRALNAHLAPELERTILRTLAKSPEQRFASAAALADELRDGTAGRGAVSVPASVAGATQRMPTVPARAPTPARRAVSPPPTSARRPNSAPAAAPAGAFARRAARPAQRRGAGAGVLALLLAMAAVLVALGAGFFGLATLSREGVATPEPTPPPPTARPTAPPKPAAVPTSTPVPEPTDTPEPTPSPVPPTPTPSPVPPSPTPAPQPTPAPRVSPVPQLRGKTLDDAQAALKAAGFTSTVVGVNENVDKNLVVRQTPDAGAPLPPGATVTIIVGTGSTAIPAVTNLPRDQAATLLQNNSFKVNLTTRRDPRIPAGIAIATNPPAGMVLPRGSPVELAISSGR
jgi:eukaryotic-like serine/threonine-protein kinase